MGTPKRGDAKHGGSTNNPFARVGLRSPRPPTPPEGWCKGVGGSVVLRPRVDRFASWCHAHNTMHHGWTNFKGREPAFPPFSKAEYDALPWWRRRLERIYRSAPGIGLFYFLDFYVKHLLLPPERHRPPYRLAFFLDRLLLAPFLACQVLVRYHLALYRIP